jgi:peptidoglycan/LPS O-acetylase OafA/YrhL
LSNFPLPSIPKLRPIILMKRGFTVLNIPVFLFLAGCIIYTIVNYSTLAREEGWGIVYMVGLFVFGSTALIADFLIKRFFKNKNTRLIASLVVLLIYVVFFFVGK